MTGLVAPLRLSLSLSLSLFSFSPTLNFQSLSLRGRLFFRGDGRLNEQSCFVLETDVRFIRELHDTLRHRRRILKIKLSVVESFCQVCRREREICVRIFCNSSDVTLRHRDGNSGFFKKKKKKEETIDKRRSPEHSS